MEKETINIGMRSESILLPQPCFVRKFNISKFPKFLSLKANTDKSKFLLNHSKVFAFERSHYLLLNITFLNFAFYSFLFTEFRFWYMFFAIMVCN